MTCPNCEAVLGEGTSPCPNCGAVLAPEPDPETKKKLTKTRIKIIIAALVVVAAALTVMLISNFAVSAKGLRLAATLSESLGRSMAVAEKNADIALRNMSDFPIFNPLKVNTYIYEDGKAVNVDGVRYPSWIVGVVTDDDGKLKAVRYANYQLLKSNHKGEKADGFIKTTNISVGMSKKDTERLIKLRPFAIEHTNDDVSTYTYRYYYIDDNGNEIGCKITLEYDLHDNVKSINGSIIDNGIPIFD